MKSPCLINHAGPLPGFLLLATQQIPAVPRSCPSGCMKKPTQNMGFKMIRLNKNMGFPGICHGFRQKRNKKRSSELPCYHDLTNKDWNLVWFNQQNLNMIWSNTKLGFLKWFKPHNQIIGIGLNKWLCFSNLGYHLLLVGGYYMVNDGY
jgi:hypothetical protein